MVKALLVSLLLSLSVTLCAQAVTMLPDHAAFVHLPELEQKRIIKGVMEFMVVMEAEHETVQAPKKSKVKYNSTELQQKIFSHLKFIQDVLINSAHAATDPFEQYRIKYLKSMTSADNQTKSDVCIYAGWISTIGTNKKCMHPSLSKISNYPKPPKVGNLKLGANDIVCNPLMFGFKDPGKETLLVAVATTSSINSSLDCMNQSQGVNRDGTKGIEDAAITAARLNQLKLAYTDPSPASQDTYLRMTKLIHQTCLCPSTLKNMYQPYLDKIRPHRTCFSLLNQYKYLRKNDCSPGAETLGLNIDILSKVVDKNLTDMEANVNKFSSKQLVNAADVAELVKLDASFKTLLDKNTETDNFCKAQASGIQICKIISCIGPTSCLANILNSQDPNKVHKVELTNGAGSVMSVATQSTQKASVSCTLPALACSVGECKNDSCAISISGGSLKNPAESSITFGKDPSKSVDVIPTGLDANSIFPVICKAPPKEPKCEVSTCAADKTSGERTCEFTVPGFALKDPTLKSFKIAKDATDNFVEVPLENGKSVKCEGKDAEKMSSCTLSIVENKDDKKKIDVSLILTLLEGDAPSTPKFDPDFAATTDDKKLEYKATIDLATIADGKKITASKFSTNFPDEVCSDTFPKGDEEPTIKLTPTPQPVNAAGKIFIIIVAKISVESIDHKGLEWDGGTDLSPALVDQKQVEQNDVKQTICVKHKEVPEVTKGKGTCIDIDPKTAEVKKATLSLAGKNRSNQNFDVKATVTLKDSDFSTILSGGYTLVWYEKNKPELTVEEKAAKDKKDADRKEAEKKVADKDKKKTEKKMGQGGDSDAAVPTDKTKTTTTETKDVKAQDGEVQTGTALTYSAPIGTAKYEICANLMKDGKVEANDCKAVPGYSAPVQQQLGPPPVPGAYRYRRW